MGIFDKFKKNKKENKVLQQDLSNKESQSSIFVIRLLMKEKCEMPDKEVFTSIMRKHLGNVDCFISNESVAGFALNDYKVQFKEGAMPAQLTIAGCNPINKDIDELTISQMWDCIDDRDRILSECKYSIIATDMMAAGLEYKERANMLMDYMEALVEAFPQCEAVFFQNSGKMFTAESIKNHNIERDKRFIYFAVNVRFFNIEGTNDSLVDTIGMSTLYLPDLQYHFHNMDPNLVVNHAYNLLTYIYDNDNPIKDGDTVDGIFEGKMNRDVQWKCHYEDSLIQPIRGLIDIYMNEYASGERSY